MPEAPVTRALRGATTVEEDTPEQIAARIQELLTEIMARNELVEDDIISIIFTATHDVVSAFPATVAPRHRVRRGAPHVHVRDQGAERHAQVPAGDAPHPHDAIVRANSATSTCTAPKGSAMTSRSEGDEPAHRWGR